jgi:hypothetical protein
VLVWPYPRTYNFVDYDKGLYTMVLFWEPEMITKYMLKSLAEAAGLGWLPI